MNRESIYKKVTETIIEKLKEGIIPWKNPMQGFLPMNFFSKHFYQGINWLLLNHLNFKSPYYLTFLQTQQKGGQILKGSKGFPVVFWKLLDGTPDDNGKIEKFPMIRISTVFNLTQTTLYSENKEKELFKSLPSAEQILSDIITKHNPIIDNNFRGKAYYKPSTHSICIPPIHQFKNPDSYFDALFHELIHWTQKNLKRESDHKFNSPSYAFEELVAEIGSSYLCSLCGLESEIENQTAYIQGWLNKLENDSNLIIKASTAAKQAVNFLIDNKNEGEENVQAN
jgi:antirestriction protein ArdC